MESARQCKSQKSLESAINGCGESAGGADSSKSVLYMQPSYSMRCGRQRGLGYLPADETLRVITFY
jgi:hypothetical protein